MDTDTRWFEALVVILSVMLALFLLLSIILVIRFIQITRQIKRITDYAEHAVDKAEEVASFFEKTATPVALMKLVANISDTISKTADRVNKSRSKGKK
jgi:predicted PurR-regulated permease PerM